MRHFPQAPQNTTHYALTNSVIYTGEHVLYQHAVVVQAGRILAIVPDTELDSTLPVVDLQGANLTAGFIDLQLNGCGGVMFNEAIRVETLDIMQATNRLSGTTSFLPTLITTSDEDMKQAVAVMREYLQEHPHQALGLHLEGPYLSIEKRGVHRAEYIRGISEEMRQFLCDHADVITKLTLAAENPAADHIAAFRQAGILVSLGHSNATYAQASQRIQEGIGFATHLHNAMSPVSSGREGGVVGAVLDSDVYTGIIVDGLHVDWSNIRLAKKIKGDKLVIVTDAVAPAGTQPPLEQFTFVGKTIRYENGRCLDEEGQGGGR